MEFNVTSVDCLNVPATTMREIVATSSASRSMELLLWLLLFWLLSFARIYRHRAARALALVARPIQALALEAAVLSDLSADAVQTSLLRICVARRRSQSPWKWSNVVKQPLLVIGHHRIPSR